MGSNKRILTIDDEPEVIDLLRILLEGASYEVYAHASGKNAWEKINELQPDLVILDIMLPGIDGYTIQTQMVQRKETRDIPVIILTALEPARTLFEKATNVKAFVSKPFKSEDLLDSVKLALRSDAKEGTNG
ncbi:PleD family two-component system response regulator [Elusimicrobiota bacterium]